MNISTDMSLIDRGENVGVVGEDMKVIFETNKIVRIQGIYSHQINDVNIISDSGVINTNRGTVIEIFHQYAHIGRGTSIHSSPQLEGYSNQMYDKSMKIGVKNA